MPEACERAETARMGALSGQRFREPGRAHPRPTLMRTRRLSSTWVLLSAAFPLLLSPALAGCGSASSPPAEDGDAVGSAANVGSALGPVLRTASGEPLVTCGIQSFPATAIEGGAGVDRPEVDAALDVLERTGGMDAPAGLRGGDPESAARILAESSDRMTVAVGAWDESGTAQGGSVIHLEKVGTGWKAYGWGDCRLAPALPARLSWATLTFDGDPPAPTAKEIRLGVTERECSSGRDPSPFLQEPAIVETDRSVTVYWTVTMPTGNQNCIGNRPTPRTITLERPLGARELMDGSTWPARPVTDSPNP